MVKKIVKKATSNKHICSNCIEEFEPKDIFIAQVPNRPYSTDYCGKCLKELGIEEFEPYLKPRKVREVKPKTTKKPATKKPATKKPATKKTTKKPATKKTTKKIEK